MFAVLPYFGRSGSPPVITPAAPTITALAVLNDRTLTITVSGTTGTPSPGLTAVLTSGGAPDTLTVVSPGVFQKVYPNSLDPIGYVGSVTAANGVAPDAVFGFSGTVRANVVPTTTYSLTGQDPVLASLALTTLSDNTLLATGPDGNVTITVTQPLAYQGTYTLDQSNEGGSGNLSFTAIGTAPQCVVKPAILRLTDADGSGTNTTGDTFIATPGLWIYDADDQATQTIAGQWARGGTPIGGATALTYTDVSSGNLTYVETFTGAGTSRTATSNTIAVSAVGNTLSVPVTTYGLIPYAFTNWSITAGDASATINSFPNVPSTPAWSITAGNAGATINDFPGEV